MMCYPSMLDCILAGCIGFIASHVHMCINLMLMVSAYKRCVDIVVVLQLNYVVIRIVNYVSIAPLHHIRCLNIGVRRTYTPRFIKKGSQDRAIFNCPHCEQEYISTIAEVSRGVWCSCITNKTESLLFRWLKKKYPDIEIQVQF